MYKKLVINVTDYETRVALLEDGTIAELFIERGDDSNIAGNIYKGRVQRVLPGMQAAFVDIGNTGTGRRTHDRNPCGNLHRLFSLHIMKPEATDVDHPKKQ